MRCQCCSEQIDCDSPEPIVFRRLTLGDIDTLRPFFRTNVRRICDSTIGATFMWRDHMKTEFAISGDVLYLRAELAPGKHVFAPPRFRDAGCCTESIGLGSADMPLALEQAVFGAGDRLAEFCREQGEALRFFPVSGAFHEALMSRFPDAEGHADPAWSDYVYNACDLIDLAGRRYSGQRNHMNKFKKLYPDWRFEAVDEQNLPRVREFLVRYMDTHRKDSSAYLEGNLKALEVLDNMDAYRQVGGVLFVGDEVAGFAFGEVVGDTLFVHTEKALTEFQGAYPMIVNQFSKMYADERVEYINREEDDGDEGLRTSKLSYHPCMLLEKWFVEVL